MRSELHDTVRRFIRRERMLEDAEPLHVGVSGGIDSMVLLDVLTRLGHPCSVIHVDHGLRGAESQADRDLVEGHCRERGIPFTCTAVDVANARATGSGSVQMVARELRYGCFERMRAAEPRRIALAHHADDAIETLFINLLRGTGVAGWAGIQPMNGPYVRPLLVARRSEIELYAKENGIRFREDASNNDPKYLRNRVRHELLPLLEDLRPGASDSIARSLATLREMVGSSIRPSNELSEIPFSDLEVSEAPGAVLLQLLRPLGFHPDMITRIQDAVVQRSTGRVFMAGDYQVVVDRDGLRVRAIREEQPVITIEADETTGFKGPFSWRVLESAAAAAPISMFEAMLDLDRLEFPLVLRPWKQGDRIRPIGLEGSKLVSDILIDAKVPKDEKDAVYVLLSGGELAWVVGHRIGEGFQRTDATQRVFVIRQA